MVLLVIMFNGISLVHTHPATAKVTIENLLLQPLKVNKITTVGNATIILGQNVTILLIITNVDQFPVYNVNFTDNYNKNYFTVINATGNSVKNTTQVSYAYQTLLPNQTVVFSTTINFSGNQTSADTTSAGFIDGTNITYYKMYNITSWIKSNSLQFSVISAQSPIIPRPIIRIFDLTILTQEPDLIAISYLIITIIFPIFLLLLLSRYWSTKKRLKAHE